MVFYNPVIAEDQLEKARTDYFKSTNKQFNADGTQTYSNPFGTERAATPQPFIRDAQGNAVFNEFIATDARTQPEAGPLAQRAFPEFADTMYKNNFKRGSDRISEVQEQGQRLIADMLNGYRGRIKNA